MARSRPQPDDAAHVTRAVARACERFERTTRVCVALSGGIDSIALLHAVTAHRDQLSAEARWPLAAHHVHHGLSRHADDWLAHCERVCAALGVPLTHQRVAVARDAAEGIEAAARAARYASLDGVAADAVLLAQHQRDQAETLLLQLLRGSGPAGLAAMAADGDRYLRPLLGVSRDAIEAYAEAHALHHIVDDSNDDTRFARNRLRIEVWPALLAAFPSAETALSRAAAHQADAAALLADLATLDARDAVRDDRLNLTALASLAPIRRANLLRHWLQANDLPAPSTATLDDWLRQLHAPPSKQAIVLRRKLDDRRSLRVYRGEAFVVADPLHWQPCDWRGEQQIELRAGEQSAGSLVFMPAIASAGAPALRAPAAHERWSIRARREGDVMQLSDNSGHVTLKNILQRAAIPPWLRDTWPLVTCDEKIVAIASVATAKAYTVRAGETGRLCEWKPAWRLPSRP